MSTYIGRGAVASSVLRCARDDTPDTHGVTKCQQSVLHRHTQGRVAPAFVLSGHGQFGPERASSVDLCTEGLISGSQFRSRAHVFGSSVSTPFDSVSFSGFPASIWASYRRRAELAAAKACELNCNVIVVQEHLPAAAEIASLWPGPVVLQTHSMQKTKFAAWYLGGSISRWRRKTRYEKLAGLIHVSNACAERFNRGWPDIALPQATIPNTLDFAEWTPARERDNCILCVGRAVDFKGILEAAEGVAAALMTHSDWNTRFILSEVTRHPAYVDAVTKALEPLGRRAVITTQATFAEVKRANEKAAIAIVPSKWDEPFGRTALEAHAGGTCLISSGTGGLREVSGPHALYLDVVQPDTIARAIDDTIRSPLKREEVAASGRERASKCFDVGFITKQLERWLEDVTRFHREQLGGESRD